MWDDELALLAQFWAVNCEMMPNENRHEQSTEFDYVGQTNGGSLNNTINLTAMVFDWYYEGVDYDYSQAACIDEDGEAAEEGCDNYIQVSYHHWLGGQQQLQTTVAEVGDFCSLLNCCNRVQALCCVS